MIDISDKEYIITLGNAFDRKIRIKYCNRTKVVEIPSDEIIRITVDEPLSRWGVGDNVRDSLIFCLNSICKKYSLDEKRLNWYVGTLKRVNGVFSTYSYFDVVWSSDFVKDIIISTNRSEENEEYRIKVVSNLSNGSYWTSSAQKREDEDKRQEQNKLKEKARQRQKEHEKKMAEDCTMLKLMSVEKVQELVGTPETTAKYFNSFATKANEITNEQLVESYRSDWKKYLVFKISSAAALGDYECYVDESDFSGNSLEYAKIWLFKNGFSFGNVVYEGYWYNKTYGYGDYEHTSPTWEPEVVTTTIWIRW